MITTTALVTKVKFGRGNKGTISIGIKQGEGILVLQELAKPKEIGDVCNPDDIKELPKAELEFFNTDSIDVLIKKLLQLKDDMNNPINTLALAC